MDVQVISKELQGNQGVLTVAHPDEGTIVMGVPNDTYNGAEVGRTLHVPDDLDSINAAAEGFERLQVGGVKTGS
jgi:hypothetical protein